MDRVESCLVKKELARQTNTLTETHAHMMHTHIPTSAHTCIDACRHTHTQAFHLSV